METLPVLYNFLMAEKGCERFTLFIDAETLELIRPSSAPRPEWTRLGFNMCLHCPY